MDIHSLSLKNVHKFYFLLLIAIFLNGCDFDQGLGPLHTKITGSVYYLSPEVRPDNVDEVRAAALVKFPPSGLGDVFFSEPIAFDRDTVDYEILLPRGEYQAVVVLWKLRKENWSFNSLIGLYGFKPPLDFQILPVNITEEEPVAENVDMTALWNLANTDGEITGEISFQGAPPQDTEAVLLAAFTQVPNFDNLLTSLLFIGGMPQPVSTEEGSYQYSLKVYNGTYKFLGLFWKGFGVPLPEMKLIGFYPDSTGSNKPGTIIVPKDSLVPGIDFGADFNSLPDGIRPE